MENVSTVRVSQHAGVGGKPRSTETPLHRLTSSSGYGRYALARDSRLCPSTEGKSFLYGSWL